MARELMLAEIRKCKSRLQPLVDRCNALHNEIYVLSRNMVQKAYEAGTILLEIKGIVPHGMFTDYIEQGDYINCSYSTASVYMDIARHRGPLEEKYGSKVYTENATLDGVMKLIREEKKAKRLTTREPAQDGKEPVDGTQVCPRGGMHEYDDEACVKCHDPRPPAAEDADQRSALSERETTQPNDARADHSPGHQGQGRKGQTPEEVALAGIRVKCSSIEQLYSKLVNALDELHLQAPDQALHDSAQMSLDVSYQDFRKWKRKVI